MAKSIKLQDDNYIDSSSVSHERTPLNEILINNSLTKLWENPNPSSTFKAQNITLSSDDYDYLIWFYKGHTNWNRLMSQMTIKGYGIDLICPFDGQMSDGKNWRIANFFRRINYTNDTTFAVPLPIMTVPNGDSYSANGVSDGYWCIPIVIYGGKFN